MQENRRAMSRDEVRARLVAMMCEITRTDPAEIGEVADDTPCVGGRLLNDSLDVLEFVVGLEREFGISIRDGDSGRQLLASVGALADHVVATRA
jgi:acyl carrier protein